MDERSIPSSPKSLGLSSSSPTLRAICWCRWGFSMCASAAGSAGFQGQVPTYSDSDGRGLGKGFRAVPRPRAPALQRRIHIDIHTYIHMCVYIYIYTHICVLYLHLYRAPGGADYVHEYLHCHVIYKPYIYVHFIQDCLRLLHLANSFTYFTLIQDSGSVCRHHDEGCQGEPGKGKHLATDWAWNCKES